MRGPERDPGGAESTAEQERASSDERRDGEQKCTEGTDCPRHERPSVTAFQKEKLRPETATRAPAAGAPDTWKPGSPRGAAGRPSASASGSGGLFGEPSVPLAPRRRSGRSPRRRARAARQGVLRFPRVLIPPGAGGC